jgi:polyisoprenoid-binding protein YceI
VAAVSGDDESEEDGGTDTTESQTDSTETEDADSAQEGDAGSDAASDAASDAGAGLDGTWSVQANEEVTFVGYRIDEVLTTVGDFTVVGRTPDVTGTMQIEGTSVTATELVAQMDTLTTDSGARDRAMRSQALETGEFPEATFSLTSPIDLGSIPAEGETISVTATGDLTIHGVTQSVDFPLEAQVVGDVIVVVGQLNVLLADYDINAPSAPVVASVEDNAILELSVAFAR